MRVVTLRAVLVLFLCLDSSFGIAQQVKSEIRANHVVDSLKALLTDKLPTEKMETDGFNGKIWKQISSLLHRFDEMGLRPKLLQLIDQPLIAEEIERTAENADKVGIVDVNDMIKGTIQHMKSKLRDDSVLDQTNLLSLSPPLPSLGDGIFNPSMPFGSFFPPVQPLKLFCSQPCNSGQGIVLKAPCPVGSDCNVSCPEGFARNAGVRVTCECEMPTLVASLVTSTSIHPLCAPIQNITAGFCSLPQTLPRAFRFLAGREYCYPGGILPQSGAKCTVSCALGSTVIPDSENPTSYDYVCLKDGRVSEPNFKCGVDTPVDACSVKHSTCAISFQHCLDMARFANNGKALDMPMCPCVQDFEECVGPSDECLGILKKLPTSKYSLALAACSEDCRSTRNQVMALCTQHQNSFCLNEPPTKYCCNAILDYRTRCSLSNNSGALLWIQPNYQNSACKYVMSNIVSFQAEQCFGSPPVPELIPPHVELAPHPSPSPLKEEKSEHTEKENSQISSVLGDPLGTLSKLIPSIPTEKELNKGAEASEKQPATEALSGYQSDSISPLAILSALLLIGTLALFYNHQQQNSEPKAP